MITATGTAKIPEGVAASERRDGTNGPAAHVDAPPGHREQSTRNGKFPASPCLPFECYARLLRYIIVFVISWIKFVIDGNLKLHRSVDGVAVHLIICVHHQTTLECYRVDCCIRRSRESIAKEAKDTHSLSISLDRAHILDIVTFLPSDSPHITNLARLSKILLGMDMGLVLST